MDGCDAVCARGWAWLPDVTGTRVPIRVYAANALLGDGTADAFRADLLAAGKGDGRCAFAIALQPPPAPGTTLRIVAVTGESEHPLTGSPCAVASTPAPEPGPDVFPLPLAGGGVRGSLDACGPLSIRGWAQCTDTADSSLQLALFEGDHEWLRFDAGEFRPDVATALGADGYCGFHAPLPAALCDGALHALELRLASGASLLAQPFHVRLRAHAGASAAAAQPPPLVRAPVDAPVSLSVIVNFYNMQREAERTLASLQLAYQQGCEGLDYEVLCIDNGSDPPLDPEWIAGFGPQFRLLRPATLAPSPCAALNAAALEARGRYLAVMIDGAHVLTPGIFHEALAAWHEDADAVVAVRHWFVGGDQRWLASSGYTRALEDQLFQRIHWPANGYELFRIGAPMRENPDPWLDSLTESNCLLLPTALFDRIGGFDPAFTDAGGGFANLDLWRRANDAATGPVVALVGEATFHQFHAGTTTNVHDDEKDLRVRHYAQVYRTLRGRDFEIVPPRRLQLRGRIHTERATGIRQRPLLPLGLSVTPDVRDGQLAQHFDEGAQRYLQAVYAECGLQRGVTWRGEPTGLAPADLIEIQRILHEQHPDGVVTVGSAAGLNAFVADVLAAANRAQLITVTGTPLSRRAGCVRLTGDPGAASLAAAARDALGVAENVLVILACPAERTVPEAWLETWSALVSHRSWLICTGTVFGQPWLGYAVQRHLAALRAFTSGAGAAFTIDASRNRQLISTCAGGFLRKTGGSVALATYDPALDALPSVVQV